MTTVQSRGRFPTGGTGGPEKKREAGCTRLSWVKMNTPESELKHQERAEQIVLYRTIWKDLIEIISSRLVVKPFRDPG